MAKKETGEFEKAVSTLKLRYAGYFLLISTCRLLVFWNFAAGSLFLVLRQTGLLANNVLLAGCIGLPLALVAALIAAIRKTSEQKGWLALIDSYNRGGGLMLAVEETADAGWREKVDKKPDLPQLRLQMSGQLLILLVSTVFMVLCLTMPVISLINRERSSIDLKEVTASLDQQIELLADEQLLNADSASEIRKNLEQIISQSDVFSPAVTFEALDQLREKLKAQGASGLQQKVAGAEKLSKLDEIAKKMMEAAGQNDSKAISAMAQKLLHELGEDQAAGSFLAEMAENLKRSLDAAASESEKLAEAAGKAAEELQNYLEQQAEKTKALAEKLANARMIDQKTFAELQKAGKIKPATEADLQSDSNSEIVLAPAQTSDATAADTLVGTQKSGSSDLKFNRKTSEHGVEFVDQNLPAPGQQALEQTVAIGVSFSAPQVQNATAGEPSAASVEWQKLSENGLDSGIILPKHRSAVKKYFDSQKP